MLNGKPIPDVYRGIARLVQAVVDRYRSELGESSANAITCPSFARLHDIVLDPGGALIEETDHIVACADCRSRIRAFEGELGTTAGNAYDVAVMRIRAQVAAIPHAEQRAQVLDWINLFPRLIFLELTAAWRNAEVATLHAWKASHVMADAVRVARQTKATICQKTILLEACGAAVASAVSRPLSPSAREHDLGWPVAAMLEETAIEVSRHEPDLRVPYARMYAQIVCLSPVRLRTLLVYSIHDVAALSEEAVELASLIAREIVEADDAIATRSILSILFHADPRLAGAIDPALAAEILAGSIFTVQRVSQRMHGYTPNVVALSTASTDPAAVVALRHQIVDLVDGFSQLLDPDQRILGLLGTQDLLRKAMEPARELPSESQDELFAAIGRGVFESEAVGGRDTAFFVFNAFQVVATAAPQRAVELLRGMLERAHVGVTFWFALVRTVVRQYEMTLPSGRGTSVPKFTVDDGRYTFEGGAEPHPFDAFCAYVAAAADMRPQLRPALDWATLRLRRWTDTDANDELWKPSGR